MERQHADCDENPAQKQGKLPTEMEMEREKTLHAAAHTVISEKHQAILEQGVVVLLTNNEILMRDLITDVPFHVKEEMTKLVLKASTAKQKDVDNRPVIS